MRIALDGWQRRSGPRYRRLAEALAGALGVALRQRELAPGDRLPPERVLADALALSRGTVVRAYEELAAAGVVERRQGAGTYVRPRPAWTSDGPTFGYPFGPDVGAGGAGGAGGGGAGGAGDGGDGGDGGEAGVDGSASEVELIDLSLPVPAATGHLPQIGPLPSLEDYGHGVHPAGLPELRAALAHYLTERQLLPTTPDQLIVTSGSQQALALLAGALLGPGRAVVTGCPTRPGLAELAADRQARLVGVPLGPGQRLDPAAVERAARRSPGAVVQFDAALHRLAGPARGELVAAARRCSAVLVEDLSQVVRAVEPPLAALDPAVVAVGSLSATFWAGLRIGWLRAPRPLHDQLLRLRRAADLAPSVPAQLLACALLRAADPAWYRSLERALTERRELVRRLLAEQLPAWRPEPLPDGPVGAVGAPSGCAPEGPALWVRLPVAETGTFAHLAETRFGVRTTPGALACADGRHLDALRLGCAQSPGTLEAAVDRLRAAWEEHSRRLAASP
ncbi:PLP-dependent aminotransferase family protein [Kitasatospora viridis]